jgi:PhnB protein
MKQLTPYLHFNGNCREAMTFYSDCFGGDLSIRPEPASPQNRVVYSSLAKGGFLLMADDAAESGVTLSGLTLYVVCSSKEELETSFSKLSAGGSVAKPLNEEYYGIVGIITDKFGINWMLKFDLKQA